MSRKWYQKRKMNQDFLMRRRKYYRSYYERKILENPEWNLRSKKYRKIYADLSPLTRFKIREAYKAWAKRNWEKRVDYARKYRRKNLFFNIRAKIKEAGESGNLREFIEGLSDSIIKSYEKCC
jgi:hypothetical protein